MCKSSSQQKRKPLHMTEGCPKEMSAPATGKEQQQVHEIWMLINIAWQQLCFGSAREPYLLARASPVQMTEMMAEAANH